MPWDDDITSNGGNGYITSNYVTYDTSGTTGTANNLVFTSVMTNCTSASTIPWQTGYGSTGGFYLQQGTTFFSNGSSGYGSGIPQFDPADVARLRKDWDAVKENRKRRRAEIKAQRLFKRVVGDVAYRKFIKKGYHEIFGAGSRACYRLKPGRWVKVMGEGNKIKYELCAHLEYGIPWFDTMVMQHLMLTASKESEDKFLGIANKHEVGYYPIEEMREAG